MSVMRALEEAEYVYTREGKKRVTHEAYSYMITPFAYPPIKVMVYKGHIDQRGTFQAVDAPRDIIITQDEFKELLCPNSHGKPAGDFRLSDILRCLKKRNAIKSSAAAGETAKADAAADAPKAGPAAPPSETGSARPAEAAPAAAVEAGPQASGAPPQA